MAATSRPCVLHFISHYRALELMQTMQEEQRKSDEGRKLRGPSDADIAVSKVLEKIAKEKGTIMTSIAYASEPSLLSFHD